MPNLMLELKFNQNLHIYFMGLYKLKRMELLIGFQNDENILTILDLKRNN